MRFRLVEKRNCAAPYGVRTGLKSDAGVQKLATGHLTMNNNTPLGRPLGLMGSVPEPSGRSATRVVRCRTEAIGRFHQRHHVRDLPPFGGLEREAEPSSLLDEETSPSPSESLLAALGSCLAISIHAGAVARSIPIRHLDVELEAAVDYGALWGTGDHPVKSSGFETISVRVRIESDAPRQTLKALVDRATLWSPVANTLHNPVHLDIALAE